jgi:hypothetical protein
MGQAAVSKVGWQNLDTLHKNSLHFYTFEIMHILLVGLSSPGIDFTLPVGAANMIRVAALGDGKFALYHRNVINYMRQSPNLGKGISVDELIEIKKDLREIYSDIQLNPNPNNNPALFGRTDLIDRLILVYDSLKPRQKYDPKVFEIIISHIVPLSRRTRIGMLYIFIHFIRRTGLVNRMQYKVRSPGILEFRFVMQNKAIRPAAGG